MPVRQIAFVMADPTANTTAVEAQDEIDEIIDLNFDLIFPYDFNLEDNDDSQLQWDSEVDDTALLQCLKALEAEGEVHREIHPLPDPDPVAPTPGHSAEPSTTSQASAQKPALKRRHALVDEEELNRLETEKDEKRTMQATQWAVTVMTGEKKTNKTMMTTPCL